MQCNVLFKRAAYQTTVVPVVERETICHTTVVMCSVSAEE